MDRLVDLMAVFIVVQRALDYREIAGEEEVTLREGIARMKSICDELEGYVDARA